MKALTESQITKINVLLHEIEKSKSKEEAIRLAEAIREIILLAEQIFLKVDL